jgi:hypothetical protein
MCVLDNWWLSIRGLTLYQEFCRESHWKRQYRCAIKIYMTYNEEKEKSHKDLWGLGSFYFIWVLGAPYYQGSSLGELVKCKSSKIPYKPISQKNWPYPVSWPDSNMQNRTCPAPSPDMSRPLQFTQSSGLIRVHCQVPVSKTKHLRLLDRTCLVITFFATAKSFLPNLSVQ